MPVTEPVDNWLKKIQVADEYFDKWWMKFDCGTSIKYYEGEQWKGYNKFFREGYKPYVVNLVFSTIEVQLPSLLFSNPAFSIKPRASKLGFDPETEWQKAHLKEAALNSFITDENNSFADEIELAILDSYFAFGMIEVGFDADYIKNPNAGKPYIKDGTPIEDNGTPIRQPDEIPEWEQIYVKRIHPAQFRVGGLDSYKLQRCNWVGYWEYVDFLSVKGNKNLKHTDELVAAGSRSGEFDLKNTDYLQPMDKILLTGDVIKIWNLWDLNAKQFHLFTPGFNKYLFERPFTRLPLFPLSYYKRTRGFYPIPPVSQWLSPQDELNEANEQLRVHRRRGARKYFVRKGVIDDQELDKVMNGPDGSWAEVEIDPSTVAAPVPLAPLEGSVDKALVVSKDNFNVVSGTASEQRGQADRTTATQATIIDTRSKIRQSKPQVNIANWLVFIAGEICKLQKRLTLPFWIQLTTNESDQGLLQEVQETQKVYDEITGDDLEGDNFDIEIDVTSISPTENDDVKNKFFEFIAVLNNFPQIAMSPTLIREAAERIGYKGNEKVIKEFQNMAILAMVGQAQNAQGGPGAAAAQRQVAKSTPNQMEQITNQLQNQVGMTQ